MNKDLLKKLNEELIELKEKLFNLEEFINSKKYFSLHPDMQYMLQDQVYSMRSYRDVLSRRIAFIEGWLKPVENTQLISTPTVARG